MLQRFRLILKSLRPLWAGLLALLLVVLASGLLENVELAAYDGWFGLRSPQTADSRIVIIGIDEPSIAQIGRWPWDRAVYGPLLDHLGEAKAVAFDVMLSEASAKPGDDAQMAAGIARSGKVVLSVYVKADYVHGQPNFSQLMPLALLLDAARGGSKSSPAMGLVNTPTSSDSVVRATLPVDTDTTGTPVPSLALAAVMRYKGYTLDQLKASSFGNVKVGDVTIRRNVDGQTYLNFVGVTGSFKTYSAADVIKGKIPPSTFKDKIVFVGATSPGLKDDFAVPTVKATTTGSWMPGVEIQATAAATFLNNTDIVRASHGVSLLITLAFGLLVLLISRRFKTFSGAVATLALMVLYAAAVYLLWSQMRLWVDVVTPLVGGILVFAVSALDNYLREEAEKRRVRGVFSRYVSRNVVAELLKNPDMLEMGGKRYEVTVLFSDIRGFTSFSEKLDPKVVVERLNEYFKDMVDIVFANGGTLDKYMGDGIMAYFGAPVSMEDHAERALKTAHQMREKMVELHARWVSQGLQPFKIGVGLNSGAVIAGNVGHPDRVEYSLIGASVNLASRLESLTKEYAKSEYGGIVCSASTYALAPRMVEELQPVDCGEVEVRGMTEKVHIYAL